MRKDNKGQQKTLEGVMFPQMLPHGKNSGETPKDKRCCDLGRITDVTQAGSGFNPQKDFGSNPDGSKYEQPTLVRYGIGLVGKQGKRLLMTHKISN